MRPARGTAGWSVVLAVSGASGVVWAAICGALPRWTLVIASFARTVGAANVRAAKARTVVLSAITRFDAPFVFAIEGYTLAIFSASSRVIACSAVRYGYGAPGADGKEVGVTFTVAIARARMVGVDARVG